MSTGLYTHTSRATGTTLTSTIYNNDHINHITNQNPLMTGAYSDSAAQMKTVTDPGGVGSESLAGSLAGELERIRFVIQRIIGGAQWYSPGNTLASPTNANGAINLVQGADIASAATVNLDTATGNYVNVTGTTGITAITLSQGRVRRVHFTGSLVITNGASLIMPSGTNVTTQAGDVAEFIGEAAGVVRCSYYTAVNAAATDSQLFTAVGANTWTKPAGLGANTMAHIELWSGGAGGATGGIQGGSGGSYVDGWVLASLLGATETATVGAGGAAGGNGGASSFGTWLAVPGSTPTTVGFTTAGDNPGAGTTNGQTNEKLGGRGLVSGSQNSIWGGGAGGGGNTVPSSAGGTSFFGGAGGIGRSAGNGAGGNGVAPSGGGGAGDTGGTGARGQVRITLFRG